MTALNKFKQHSVLYVNTLFTIFSILFPLSSGIKFCWFAIWILTPIFMPTDKSFQCVIYMSLYMRVQNSVKLFSIIICLSIFIILIKELFMKMWLGLMGNIKGWPQTYWELWLPLCFRCNWREQSLKLTKKCCDLNRCFAFPARSHDLW